MNLPAASTALLRLRGAVALTLAMGLCMRLERYVCTVSRNAYQCGFVGIRFPPACNLQWA